MKRPLLFISLALVLAVVAGAFAFISFRASGPETDVTTATVDTPSAESVPGPAAVGSTVNGSENGASGDTVVTGKSVGADLGISDDVVITGDTAPSKASKPHDSGSDLYDLGSDEMCPYGSYGDEL